MTPDPRWGGPSEKLKIFTFFAPVAGPLIQERDGVRPRSLRIRLLSAMVNFLIGLTLRD